MASLTPSLFLFLFLFLFLSLLLSSTGTHHHHNHLRWAPSSSSVSNCDGSVGDCAVSEEFDVEFEGGGGGRRRVLAGTNFISYAALRRDAVPCSQRGHSYYNCRPGALANPFTRGCNAITQCRS